MKFADVDRRAGRVGFRPPPWAWSGRHWAGADGRFNGRWDPLEHGLYRTVYTGDTLLACVIELLAPHRPDRYLVTDMAALALLGLTPRPRTPVAAVPPGGRAPNRRGRQIPTRYI